MHLKNALTEPEGDFGEAPSAGGSDKVDPKATLPQRELRAVLCRAGPACQKNKAST
jgi:hypothetical protein